MCSAHTVTFPTNRLSGWTPLVSHRSNYLSMWQPSACHCAGYKDKGNSYRQTTSIHSNWSANGISILFWLSCREIPQLITMIVIFITWLSVVGCLLTAIHWFVWHTVRSGGNNELSTFHEGRGIIVSQVGGTFPSFYRHQRFVTVFTRTHRSKISWARWIQSTLSSMRSILILSSHQSLGITNSLFHSGFQAKTLYALVISLMCATCPGHLILLNMTILVRTDYEVTSYVMFSILLSLPLSWVQHILDTLFPNSVSPLSC
jgi:hypothetical protein